MLPSGTTHYKDENAKEEEEEEEEEEEVRNIIRKGRAVSAVYMFFVFHK